jgi:hypothetical protein
VAVFAASFENQTVRPHRRHAACRRNIVWLKFPDMW